LLVVHEQFLPAISSVASNLHHLETIVIVGGAPGVAIDLPNAKVFGWDDLSHSEPITETEPSPQPEDLALLVFTSGTTGRSKACALSNHYTTRQVEIFADGMGLREGDVHFSPFPLFHADASLYTVGAAILLGNEVRVGERFSVRRFWDEVRESKATVFDFMGATLTMLHKQPRDPSDGDNPARLAWGIPMPAFADEFEERFRLDLVDGYGMTECGVVIYNPGRTAPDGSCGRVVAPYEVRIVDRNRVEVPAGEVGEIAVRSSEPNLMMLGYFRMPEETAAMMSEGWLYTGDLGSFDTDGYFYFRGRKKDALRRRGQNISAFEVEEVIDSHPDILESAVFGVASDLTEQEVMAAAVPAPGSDLHPEDLHQFCAGRMADFMLPRYIDFVSALPKTATAKVEKAKLEQRGITPTTWDAEQEPG
jgi:carnitine-CoA ligase